MVPVFTSCQVGVVPVFTSCQVGVVPVFMIHLVCGGHSVYAMPRGCGYSIAISGRCGLYLHYFLLIVTLQNVATLHVYMCSTSQ